ncbi:GGDEF domain-containing protein [Catenovulum sp. SM1970]|uniref:GGDEF domain-containing protein n=1 Tax=Marinifaba aquimaris TaxID=2741323 RepID=UPI001572E98F|nr:GGDEF domain-containing protein [Marinifaba aquimaris]NTS77268.1 GGDEF domain-containing protein [Marinifaba aquimaris]
MTIFQKMLLTPIISLIILIGVTIDATNKQASIEDLKAYRSTYVPLLTIAKENIFLFKQMRNLYKDAITADEPEWLYQAKDAHQQILKNIDILQHHKNIVDNNRLIDIQAWLETYTYTVEEIVKQDLAQQADLHTHQESAQLIKHLHIQIDQGLKDMAEQTESRFYEEVEADYIAQEKVVVQGGGLAIGLLLLTIFSSLYLSISTRNSLIALTERIKALASGKPDFSKRVQRRSNDEIRYLVFWFNRLQDKLEASYKEIAHAAITDQLTKLNNRKRCDEYLAQTIKQAETGEITLAAVVADIDHFKAVNDNYGHLTGDKVLKQFADILRSQANEHAFLGRWGGEEFVLLLKNYRPEHAHQYCEQLRQSIAGASFKEAGMVTASFGMSVYQPGDSEESLMSKADHLLYQAKENGRNRVESDI